MLPRVLQILTHAARYDQNAAAAGAELLEVVGPALSAERLLLHNQNPQPALADMPRPRPPALPPTDDQRAAQAAASQSSRRGSTRARSLEAGSRQQPL